MAQYVLEAQNITKDFTGVRALDEVSFSVKNGEIMGLIGENGAGKSTILKVINGIYPTGTFEGKLAVSQWCRKYNIKIDKITARKPPHVLVVDDRGFRYEGDWSAIIDFLNPESLKPWNK